MWLILLLPQLRVQESGLVVLVMLVVLMVLVMLVVLCMHVE